MNKKIIIVAPHADDETLGCGGTILKNIANGNDVYWLLVTKMKEEYGYSSERIKTRNDEILKVTQQYNFKGVYQLDFKPAELDTYPMSKIIQEISTVIDEIKPQEIFTTYRNDAHTDHQIVYDCVMASTKTFRYPYVKRVLAYETISETDFGLKPENGGFKPNVYVDIGDFLEIKLGIMEIYHSECGEFPFPRSRKAIASQSYLRGVQCNAEAAEAFMLIKEIL